MGYPFIEGVDIDLYMDEAERDVVSFSEILDKARNSLSLWSREISQDSSLSEALYSRYLSGGDSGASDPFNKFCSSRLSVLDALLRNDHFKRVESIIRGLLEYDDGKTVSDVGAHTVMKSSLMKFNACQLFAEKHKIFEAFLQCKMIEGLKDILAAKNKGEKFAIGDHVYQVLSSSKLSGNANLLNHIYREVNIIHILEKQKSDASEGLISEILEVKFSIYKSMFEISKAAKDVKSLSLIYKTMSGLNQTLNIDRIKDIFGLCTYRYLKYLVTRASEYGSCAPDLLEYLHDYIAKSDHDDICLSSRKIKLIRMTCSLLSRCRPNEQSGNSVLNRVEFDKLCSAIKTHSRSSSSEYCYNFNCSLHPIFTGPKMSQADSEGLTTGLYSGSERESASYSRIISAQILFLYESIVNFLDNGVEEVMGCMDKESVPDFGCPFSNLLATAFSGCKRCKCAEMKGDLNDHIREGVEIMLKINPEREKEASKRAITDFLRKRIFFNCDEDCESTHETCDVVISVRRRLSAHAVKCVELIVEYLALYMDDHRAQGVKRHALPYLLLRLISLGELSIPPDFSRTLKTVPVRSWVPLANHLIYFMDHTSDAVKSIIVDVMMSIAVTYPRVVLYKTVFFSSIPQNSRDARGRQAATFYEKLKNEMMNRGYEDLLLWTGIFVEELQKIAITQPEVYLDAVRRVYDDINKSIDLMRVYESTGAGRGGDLMEYYHSLVGPIIKHINGIRADITPRSDLSSHEKRYYDAHCTVIGSVLNALKNPPSHDLYTHMKENWGELAGAADYIEYTIYTNDLCRNMKIEEYSPILKSISDSCIPIPLVQISVSEDVLNAEPITVSSVCPRIDSYHTRSRPRKIQIIGSDGKHYSYLLKGAERIYQDEMVHHFFKMADITLGKEAILNTRLAVRSYDVIALGEKLGIARWVEDTYPIHTLYRDWSRHRHVVGNYDDICLRLGTAAGDIHCSTYEIPKKERPSMDNYFYSVSCRVLRAHNLSPKTRRHLWPLGVCVDVYKKMLRVSPNYLIRNDFWLNSIDYSTWWNKCRSFTISVGLTSIIGYAIGLGDRHLGNILLDRTTGELVHVDYGVCFNLGKNLRIPEIVPFRLTQNMELALCISRPGGPFLDSSEKALQALRSNKIYFHAILDVFSYNPFVNWRRFVPKTNIGRSVLVNIHNQLLGSFLGRSEYPCFSELLRLHFHDSNVLTQ